MITLGARGRSTAAGLLLAGLLLTGCTAAGDASSGGGGDTADRGTAESAPRSAEGGGAAAAADSAAAVGAAGGGSDLAADEARQVITTASATVVLAQDDTVADVVGRIAVAVEGAGGRVEQRSVQTPQDGPASAQLTLRVPADGLNQTVEGLSDYGDVEDVQVTATDVTAQATDLDARIAALRTSTDRLTTLLAGAESTEEVVAAESALTQRQAELDSLTSQRALLAGQVQLATLSLYVAGPDAVPTVEPGGFLGGLAAGWRALVASVAGLLVVLGAVLPWLVAGGLVVAVVLALVRLARRLRGAAPAPAPVPVGGRPVDGAVDGAVDGPVGGPGRGPDGGAGTP